MYSIGNTGPVLLLLHGGGHSALSWAVFAVGEEWWQVLFHIALKQLNNWTKENHSQLYERD